MSQVTDGPAYFGIENGELETETTEQSFVLGVEYGNVRHRVGEPVIVKTVHTSNQRRVNAMLLREGYFIRWYINDDWSDLIAAKDPLVLEDSEDDGA